MTRSEVFRYGLRYVGWYFLTWFVLSVVFYIFPDWWRSGSSIATVVMAAAMTYSRFLKDKLRLPSKPEYWSLVLLSTTLSIFMELLFALVIMAQLGMFGPDVWLAVLGAALLQALLAHLLFYSRFVGTAQLKRIQKKHQLGKSDDVRPLHQ